MLRSICSMPSLRDPPKILILYSSWRIQQHSLMVGANDSLSSISRPYFEELKFTGFREKMQLTLWSSFMFSCLLHKVLQDILLQFTSAYCFSFLHTVSDNLNLKFILRKQRYNLFSRHLLQWFSHHLKPKHWLSVLYRYFRSQYVYFHQILNCPKSSLKCVSTLFASV